MISYTLSVTRTTIIFHMTKFSVANGRTSVYFNRWLLRGARLLIHFFKLKKNHPNPLSAEGCIAEDVLLYL